MVIRSDGEITSTKIYRGKKAVENFVESILEEQKKINNFLKQTKKFEMNEEDWQKMRNQKECYICDKSLIQKEFLDSVPVWALFEEEYEYIGQTHKKCYNEEKKNDLIDIKILNTKNKQENEKKECTFCKEPLMRKNFRDAEQLHCKITANFIGAVYRKCKQKQNYEKKTIPVIFHNLKGYDSHLIIKKYMILMTKLNAYQITRKILYHFRLEI